MHKLLNKITWLKSVLLTTCFLHVPIYLKDKNPLFLWDISAIRRYT